MHRLQVNIHYNDFYWTISPVDLLWFTTTFRLQIAILNVILLMQKVCLSRWFSFRSFTLCIIRNYFQKNKFSLSYNVYLSKSNFFNDFTLHSGQVISFSLSFWFIILIYPFDLLKSSILYRIYIIDVRFQTWILCVLITGVSKSKLWLWFFLIHSVHF